MNANSWLQAAYLQSRKIGVKQAPNTESESRQVRADLKVPCCDLSGQGGRAQGTRGHLVKHAGDEAIVLMVPFLFLCGPFAFLVNILTAAA